MNKRILLKLSGEALMGNSPFGIDVATISSIAKEVKKVHKLGYLLYLQTL